MAKANSILVRLNSTAGTGHFYTTRINPRKIVAGIRQKLRLKKYDPVARKHVEYKEGKIK